MNASQAIKLAKSRVRIYRFGRQWIVNVYDSDYKAWRQGNPCEWHSASRAYRENLIYEALDALGADDAAYEANRLSETAGKWNRLVAAFIGKAVRS